MLFRGWSVLEVKGLIGGNLMRIMDKVDQVKLELAHELPSSAVWDKRVDLPATHWGGGPDQPYFPLEVRDLISKRVYRDEL
jgi:membrane dipeptidase